MNYFPGKKSEISKPGFAIVVARNSNYIQSQGQKIFQYSKLISINQSIFQYRKSLLLTVNLRLHSIG